MLVTRRRKRPPRRSPTPSQPSATASEFSSIRARAATTSGSLACRLRPASRRPLAVHVRCRRRSGVRIDRCGSSRSATRQRASTSPSSMLCAPCPMNGSIGMGGIAQQRHTAKRPRLKRRSVEHSPLEHLLSSGDQRPHLVMPPLEQDQRLVPIASCRPGLLTPSVARRAPDPVDESAGRDVVRHEHLRAPRTSAGASPNPTSCPTAAGASPARRSAATRWAGPGRPRIRGPPSVYRRHRPAGRRSRRPSASQS